MPDNILYSVQLPDGRTTQWSQDQYEKAKDDLFAKYPEASVVRTSAYNPEDTDVSASDRFDIQLPDGRTTQWTQEQFSKAGADLMTKYPDAQIVKTSDMSAQYWEPKMQEAKQRLDEFNAQHGQFMKEYEFNKGLADSLELEGVTQSGEHDFVAANDAQYQPLSRQREQLRKAYYGNPLVAREYKANANAAEKLRDDYSSRAEDADTGSDRRDWKRAAKLQDDIRKLYDAPNKYIEELDGSNGFAKFLKDYRAGAGDVLSDKDFWTRGLTEIARNIDLRGIAKKMEEAANAKPEGLSENDIDLLLTPGEKAQIMSFYRLAEAQKDRAENISGGYTAGGSFAESLGFMAEFMLSSGLANVAGKALSTSSKGFASWLGRELMSERAFNRAVEKGLAVATDFDKLSRGAKAARLADEYVAKPLVQGLWHTGTQVGTLATISDGLLDTDSNGQLISVGRSILNGVMDSIVENWSESFGGAIEKTLALPFEGVSAIGKRTLGKTGFGRWARWLYNSAPTQLLKEAGFNGMIGEMAEEWAGNAVRVGLGLMTPDEFKDFASWEQQLEMAASFAPMSLVGLGTSSYSALRHSQNYNRLAGQVQDILQKQGVSQDNIDALFNTRFDTPEDIAKKFAPYLRNISADTESPTAKEDYKTMLDFAKEVGIKTVVDEMDQMDQADKRNDMREVISGTTGRFWQEFDSPEAKDADGNPVRIQQVRVLEYADGHPVYIVGGSQDVPGESEALLATVDETGKKGFIKQSDIDAGIADGTIASDREMMLDDYLQQRVDATNKDSERQRMSEETRKQIGDIRATIEGNPSFNMGTEESPIPATVVAMNGDGVHVVFNHPVNGQGEQDLLWHELGDYLGMPIIVKTDEQIEADAAKARDEAQQRLRDIQMITPGTEITVRLGEGETAEDVRYPFQQAIMDDGQIMVYYLDENGESKQVSEEMVVNLPELTELAKAEVPAEAAASGEPAPETEQPAVDDGVPRDFRGNEIPLLKNGEVNRDAFFKNDTEAWARWNDEQNQDGGADSIQTIQAAMAKVSSDLAKAQAEHDKMSSPGDRYAKKGEIEAMNNRLAELQGILDGYAPAEAVVEEREEVAEAPAEPVQSSTPSERIPKDKKGNMLFEKASVEDTSAALMELAGNDLKLAISTARSMNAQVRGDVKKAEKAKVKGANPVQIIQNTRAKEQKVQELQDKADYWGRVVDNLRKQQEARLAAIGRNERELNEPQRLEEAVANYLASLEPNSLDRADFKRELGWGNTEMQSFFRLWAKAGSGKSLVKVAEDMAADDQTGFVPVDANGNKDVQAVRDAIISVMNEVSSPGELKNYTRNANMDRLAEMAEFLEAEEAKIEEAVEEAEPAQMGDEDMPDFEQSPAAEPAVESPAVEEAAAAETVSKDVAEQIEAARQDVDTNPTEAQKEAGNYKKGHVTIDGYDISIENPKGSIRRGTDAKGNEWQVEMHNDYGYIRMTEGVDGDHIDVFLSDNPSEGNVFVVDQVDPETGEFDEHKVMYGFPDAESARAAYLSNYSEGWQGLGVITEVTKDEFKKWIESSHRKTKPFSEYKSVTSISGQNEATGVAQQEETPEERRERVTNEAIAYATGQTVEEVAAQREAEKQAAETEQPAEAEKAEENAPAAEETATEAAPEAESQPEKAEEGQEKTAEQRATELASAIAEKERNYQELYSAWLRDGSMTAEQTHANMVERRKIEDEQRALESELLSLLMSMSADQRAALRIGANEAMNEAIDSVEAKLAMMKRISRVAKAIQSFQKLIKTKAKALGKLNLYSFTSSDDNRPAMTGVFHDKGYAVASDTTILIADKESYQKAKEGKIVNKRGETVNAKFPKWRDIVPNDATQQKAKVNFGELRDFLASVRAQREADWEREKAEGKKVDAKKKYVDDTIVLLNVGKDAAIGFRLGKLSLFADAAERYGAKEILFQDARRAVVVKTKKGIVMVMPTQVNEKLAQTTYETVEENARELVETWNWYSFGENEMQKQDAEQSKREENRQRPFVKRAEKWKKLLGDVFEVITDLKDVSDERARQDIEKADAAVAAGESREDNKVSGWFDTDSKKAFIYLPHVANEADLDRTIIHEVVAHKGLRGLFKDEGKFNEFLDSVWETDMNDQQKELMLDYYADLPFPSEEARKRAAADEFVAHYAERNTSIIKDLDESVWSRIVEAVKRIIEDMVGQDIWEASVDVVTPFDKILRDSVAEFVAARTAEEKKKAEMQQEMSEEAVDFVEGKRTKSADTSNAENNPQVPISQTQEKYEDFGKKIGWARKDLAKKGIKKGNGDSRPAWMKKYKTVNIEELSEADRQLAERLGVKSPFREVINDVTKGTDFDKAFVAYYSKTTKGYFGSRESRHFITGEDRRPIIFTSLAQYEATLPVFEAKEQGYRIVPRANKFKIVRSASNGKLVEYAEFDTREEAAAYLASPEGCTELLNRKRENYELPALTELTRNGMPDYRNGRNIRPEDFQEAFGFRGGEFGNWLNAEERQQFLNYAYDALMDLANILGISPRALSLNGELSIAFGARGKQGARAHYEPTKAVINLTKMNGAGSLAHEWAHALDNYFGLMDSKTERNRDEDVDANGAFLSEGTSWKKGAREEMRQAFRNVMDAIKKKTVTRVIAQEETDEEVNEMRKRLETNAKNYRVDLQRGRTTYKYNRKTKQREMTKYTLTDEQLAEYDRLIDQLVTDPTFKWEWDYKKMSFRATGEVATKLYDLIKDIMPNRAEKYGPLHNVFWYMDKLRPLMERSEQAKAGAEETVTVKTDVLKESEWFDRARASGYYATDVELFARAFETYVSGQMHFDGKSSDYLTYEKGPLYKKIWDHSPYPDGEEREAVKGAFDAMFKTIQEKVDEKTKNTVLFRKAFHGSGADFDAFDHSHIGEGEGLQVHGWGTYVSFSEATGRKYARQVGGSDDQYSRAIRSIDNQLDRDKASLAKAKNDTERRYYEDAIALGEQRKSEMARHLYEVEIPDDNGENYIDEMRTLSKSGRRRIADEVRKIPEEKLDRTLHGPNWLPQGFQTLANVIEREQYAGLEIIQRLEDALGHTNEARKETAAVLHRAGFVGLKYNGRQDGPSAVIFDDSDLVITDHIRFRKSGNEMFISNAAQAVESIRQEKATPEQWLKMIEKNGGLKAGEDKWIGLSDWLKSQNKKTLTKQEIVDYIEQNRIQVEEVGYSGNPLEIIRDKYPTWEDAFTPEENWDGSPTFEISDAQEAASIYNSMNPDDEVFVDEDGDLSADDEIKVVRFAEKQAFTGAINPVRLDYTTEGLTNKREIALTVPTIKPWREHDETHFGDAGGGRAIAWVRFGETRTEMGVGESPLEVKYTGPQSENEAQRRAIDGILINWNDQESTMRNIAHEDQFWSAKSMFENSINDNFDYFSEADKALAKETLSELAKLSPKDFEAVYERGGRILFIDEIQSNRHQEGRKYGYRDEELAKKADRRGWLSSKSYGEGLTHEEYREFKALQEELYNIGEYNVAKNREAIPAAPFEKNWHELAMKRMLRLAAEEGYDFVAWTTGEQQSDRYDLRSRLSKIDVHPAKDGTRIVNAFLLNDPDGDYKNMLVNADGMIEQGFSAGNSIADVFGKEMADKIMSATDSQTLRDDSLRIGGEGMKSFYNGILPRFMDKYGKKWGVSTKDMLVPLADGTFIEAHSVEVTPEMKESVMQGQLLFRRSPQRPASFTEGQEGINKNPVGVAFTSPEDTGGRLDTDGKTDANIQTFFEKTKKTEKRLSKSVKIDPSFIGRQLTKDEIATTIEAIERIASPRPEEIPFTRENYNKLFSDGKETPIGHVKMGGSQFEKFSDLGRTNQLAMADETLRNPDLIIEKPSTAKDGQTTERPSSFIFVKAFDNPGGKPKDKIIYYNSISAKKDGLEVVMSNYETNRNRVKNDIEKGKLTYVNSVALSSESGNSVQGDQFAVPAGDDFSNSEVTNNSEKNNKSTNISSSEHDSGILLRKSAKEILDSFDNDGLAALVGEDNVPEYYNNLYRAIPEEIRESVINRLGDIGLDFHRAMRTHLSDLAFNGIQNDESGLLRLAGTMLQDYIDGDVTLSDRALEYIFWRSGKDEITDTVDIAINNYLKSRAKNERSSIRFRKGDLALSLEAAQSAAGASAQQAQETLDEKKKILKGDLLTVAKAMAAQKEYDKSTIDSIVSLAKALMKEQFIDTLNRREIGRLLGIVTTSLGKAPRIVKKNADILVDMIVDHLLRSEEDALTKLVNTKATKLNASGVEVQGQLDIHGQNMLKAYKAGLDMEVSNDSDDFDELTIKGRLAVLTDRLTSQDDAVRAEAQDEYNGLMLALEYHENIKASRAEEKGLKNEMKDADDAYRDGDLSRTDHAEFIADCMNALRENRTERIEAYRELRNKMAGIISGSIDASSEFRDRETARIEAIHHLANSDMQGQSASPDQQLTRLGHFVNSSFFRFFASPLATFDQMLRLFGRKNVSGEGYLWNKYMRSWVEATEKAYLGQKEAKSELDMKVSEVFGRDMMWSDLYAEERKMPTVKVKWWDGGEKKDHELTQGNLLYIYMVNKMADGRMKLRRMGIDEADVKAIERQMDKRFLRLADWLQNEYLVQKRNKYNAVHERLFGASMAAIDNYFPLKINKRSLNRAEDIGKADDFDALPATTTGSIIKRRRNAQNLDLLNADAFSVVIEHIDQMEQWAAFAEFNKDVNTLLSYKRFRNQVQNMTTVYGAGTTLWKKFMAVCAIAGNSYRPKTSDQSRAAVNMAKGVTSAKISLRVYTALKQFLSMPAFLADANVKHLAGNMAKPWEAWNWAMENLPVFEKRWRSRIAGDTRLMTTDSDWKIFRDRTYEKLSRIGMYPNAFVDAVTVAIGAHSIYQSKYDKYIRDGYSEEISDKKAKQDATVLYNETQQSSESAFLSYMQLDRDWISASLSVFRNSSMGFQRQLHDALRNIVKMMKSGYKEESLEYMQKQMERDGLNEEQARHAAERRYEEGMWHNAVRIATFGFGVQFFWNLGPYLAYLLFGDDDDEKKAMVNEALIHALLGGSLEGLAGGNVASEILNMIAKGESLGNYDPSLLPIISDLMRLLKTFGTDEVAGMYDLIGLGVQIGVGVNPETISDAVVAIVDACEGEMDTAREAMLLIMRVLQVPQSQLDKIYIDELGTDARGARRMTYREMAERYANYKLNKDAGPLRWAYSDELEKKREKAYLKSFKKKVNERKEPKKK